MDEWIQHFAFLLLYMYNIFECEYVEENFEFLISMNPLFTCPTSCSKYKFNCNEYFIGLCVYCEIPSQTKSNDNFIIILT